MHFNHFVSFHETEKYLVLKPYQPAGNMEKAGGRLLKQWFIYL